MEKVAPHGTRPTQRARIGEEEGEGRPEKGREGGESRVESDCHGTADWWAGGGTSGCTAYSLELWASKGC